MLVRQRVVHGFNQRLMRQDLFAHFIHGGLDTGAVILRKGLEGDIPRRLPGIIEFGHIPADLVKGREPLPGPRRLDVCAKNPVPHFGEGGILVAHEAPELRARALQDTELVDGRLDVNTRALGDIHLDVAGFFTVADERVRVRFPVDVQPGPAVGDDASVRNMDVLILVDEVGADDGSEELRGCHRMLLG